MTTQAEAAGIVVELLTLIDAGDLDTNSQRIVDLDRRDLNIVAGVAIGMLYAATEMRAEDIGVQTEKFLKTLGLNAARWAL